MKLFADLNAPLMLTLWRRGRDTQTWRFEYFTNGDRSWFTTPGWYKVARKYVYRLTIDHDYPHRPLWLGKRVNGEWINTESLYEPLIARHANFLAVTKSFVQKRNRRSKRRVQDSRSAAFRGYWEALHYA